MTTSQSRNLRKAGAVALSLALAMSTLAITPASAAKKVKLAKSKISVNVGKTKTVKIKNVKKKQVKKLTVKSSKGTVAKAKASKKTAIKVTGKKKGSAKVTANLKLKKKVGGKKAYKLTLKVTVKNAAPAPAPTVSPVPTAAPVISGESVMLDSGVYTCAISGGAVTMTAKITPANSNEVPTWSFADPTIAKAVVSGSGAAVNGIATADLVGLKEGKTTVTVKLANGQASSANVVVEAEKIAVKVVNAAQSKANEIKVTFDRDATKDNMGFGGKDKTKFDVEVLNDKGQATKSIPVNKITDMAADGLSAKLALNSALTDKAKIVVNLYKGKTYGSKADFTAEIGEVASIGVVTKTAQCKVPTDVEVAVYNANGMDITAAVSLVSKVTWKWAGDTSKYTKDTSDATKPKITMNEVGAKAEVTVGYKKNTTDTKDTYTNIGIIECVKAEPVYGTGHFQKTGTAKKWDDDDTGTARFYKTDKDITSVSVAKNGSVDVSFYAADADGNAITYDSYKIGVSNGDIAAAVTVDEKAATGGKYFNFRVTGLKADESCNVNISAIKYGETASYLIPVGVTSPAEFTTFTISPNRTKVSNTFDETYQDENIIKYTAKDSADNDITPDAVVYEITSPTERKGRTIKYNDANKLTVDKKFSIDSASGSKGEPYQSFDAAGAAAGSYTVKATAYKGSTKLEATTTITVENVPDSYFISGKGASVTYGVVIDKDKVSNAGEVEIKDNTEKTATVRLAAFAGSTTNAPFLAYVDGTNNQIGNPSENDYTTDNVNFVTGRYNVTNFLTGEASKFVFINAMIGGKFTSGDNTNHTFKLYDGASHATGTKFVTGNVLPKNGAIVSVFNTSDAANCQYYSDESNDTWFAKKGEYTVTVKFKAIDSKGKAEDKQATGTITVKNSINIPEVSAEYRTLDSLSSDNIIKALKSNVDLNCNASNNGSIIATYYYKLNEDKKSVLTKVDSLDGKEGSISYVGVKEDSFEVVVPCVAGFETK